MKLNINQNDMNLKQKKKEKKNFIKKNGDWKCPYCFNINFAFRSSCNRCRLSKQVKLTFSQNGNNNMQNINNIINNNMNFQMNKIIQNNLLNNQNNNNIINQDNNNNSQFQNILNLLQGNNK